LFTETPAELLPTVALLCQGQIAPTSPAWRSAWPSGCWGTKHRHRRDTIGA
jgi:hypothetical protein